jgi:hypothetical protein
MIQASQAVQPDLGSCKSSDVSPHPGGDLGLHSILDVDNLAIDEQGKDKYAAQVGHFGSDKYPRKDSTVKSSDRLEYLAAPSTGCSREEVQL